jgi:hypothetical protein
VRGEWILCKRSYSRERDKERELLIAWQQEYGIIRPGCRARR